MAGAPLSYWIGFHLLVLVLLAVDLLLPVGRDHRVSARLAWGWTAFLALIACGFAFFILREQGHTPALEFVSGYLIETSLSVDNLFVFLLLFRGFRLSQIEQRRALLWGVLGAIAMRASFIALGVELLQRFSWIQYVFGAFLLFAAVRLLMQHPGEEQPSRLVRWIRPIGPKTAPDAALALGTFLLIIAAVEITDLVFALDSIPAVLAITRRPFIAYTSNIFAILGLRSLFFALSGMLDRFRLLHYGLAAILAFVALKMLLAHFVTVSVAISLAVILSILAIFLGLSFVPFPRAKDRE
jgi:tellurite resistance protein TerC